MPARTSRRRSPFALATSIVAAATVSLLVSPTAAWARGDGWEPLEVAPFDAPGCGTTLHISFPVNREYVRQSPGPDGTIILQFTGSLFVTFTTDAGESITVNASGPGMDVVYPNGDFEVHAEGWNVQGPLTPEQAADLGTPELFASTGLLDFTFNSDGSATPISIPNHVIDLCAELVG
jgi:hypothetical protein